METIKLNIAYGTDAGSLSLIPPNLGWQTCREVFHNAIVASKQGEFIFACGNKLDNVVNFINECEKRLNLDKKIIFKKTNINGVLYVDASAWWIKQQVRISLLTALLRCGLQYEKDFQSALFSKNYTVQTKPAVDRFFLGYTHYMGVGVQWMATFNAYNGKIDYPERTLFKEDDANVSEEAKQEANHLMTFARENNEILAFHLAKSLDNFFKLGSKNKVSTKVCGEVIT